MDCYRCKAPLGKLEKVVKGKQNWYLYALGEERVTLCAPCWQEMAGWNDDDTWSGWSMEYTERGRVATAHKPKEWKAVL